MRRAGADYLPAFSSTSLEGLLVVWWASGKISSRWLGGKAFRGERMMDKET